MAATATVHKRVDIRRNDTVKVLSGRDKGKQGRVLRVFPDTGRVLVEHVMLVKKHLRPSQKSKGGIAEQESAVSISKVQLVCSTCGPVRIVQEVRNNAGQVKRVPGRGFRKVREPSARHPQPRRGAIV